MTQECRPVVGQYYDPVVELFKIKNRLNDLEARLPKPYRYVRYVNIYEHGHGEQMFATEEAAERGAKLYGYKTFGRYVKTVRIEFDG